MTIQHVDIADPDRHEVKGASSASDGQVLKSNGNGTTSFVNPNTLSNIGIATSLTASSTTDQTPSGINAPLQVVFGSGSSDTNVDVDIDGTTTILNSGLYSISLGLSMGRSGTTNSAILVYRILVNGSQIRSSRFVRIDGDTSVINIQDYFLRSFLANDEITVELSRDSSGEDDGSLITLTPGIVGWGVVPSATLTIQKIAGGV